MLWSVTHYVNCVTKARWCSQCNNLAVTMCPTKCSHPAIPQHPPPLQCNLMMHEMSHEVYINYWITLMNVKMSPDHKNWVYITCQILYNKAEIQCQIMLHIKREQVKLHKMPENIYYYEIHKYKSQKCTPCSHIILCCSSQGNTQQSNSTHPKELTVTSSRHQFRPSLSSHNDPIIILIKVTECNFTPASVNAASLHVALSLNLYSSPKALLIFSRSNYWLLNTTHGWPSLFV